MKMVLKLIAALLFVVGILLIFIYFWAGSGTVKKSRLSGIVRFQIKDNARLKDNPQLRIITFNCGYFSGMRNNLPDNPSKDFYMKNINEFFKSSINTGAEIICFQEIDLSSKRSYFINQPDYLTEKMGFMNYSFAVNWNKKYVPFPYWPISSHFGKMLSSQSIISKYPILNNKRIKLKRPDNPFYYDRFYLNRLIQDVTIKVGEKTLTILNIHLEAFESKTRESQARSVIEYYRTHYKNRGPLIILGDLNCTPPYAEKKSGFSDEPETDYSKDSTLKYFYEEETLKEAYPENNKNEYTFPSSDPDRKLDYIFYTDKYIKFIKASVIKINSSDHLPVMIECLLKR